MKYKKWLFWCAAGATTFLLFCLLMIWLNEERIERTIWSNIEQNISTCVQSDEIDFSLFPIPGVKLENLIIEDLNYQILIHAEECNVQLRLIPFIFRSKILFENLTLSDGGFNYYINKKGKSNAAVLNSPSSSNGRKFIGFKNIKVENFDLYYIDKRSDTGLHSLLEKARFKGFIKDSLVAIEALLHTKTLKFENSKTAVSFSDHPFTFKGQISYITTSSTLNLSSSTVQSGNSEFTIEGNPLTLLSIKGRDIRSEDIFPLLPADILNQVHHYSIRGKYDLEAMINRGDVDVVVELLGNDLQLNERDIFIEDGYGKINILTAGVGTVEIPSFTGKYKNDKIEGSFLLTDFYSPTIDLSVTGNLPAATVQPYITSVSFTDPEQQIRCFPLNIIMKKNNVDLSGRLESKKLNIIYDQIPVEIKNLRLGFQGDHLVVDRAYISTMDSRFNYHGVIENHGTLWATPGTRPFFRGHISGEQINLKHWYNYFTGEREISIKNVGLNEDGYVKSSPVNADLQLGVEKMIWNRRVGENFTGTVEWVDDLVDFNFKGSHAEGQFAMIGSYHSIATPSLNFSGEIENVDVKKIFYQWDNLYQKVVDYTQISGQTSAIVKGELRWNSYGEVDGQRSEVLGSYVITDGRIQKLEMLRSFSKYIHLEDLMDLHFGKIENVFSYKNGAIFLPVMQLKSNALNLYINGIHETDHDIIYNIIVNVSEVLRRKMKISEKPQAGAEWLDLHYHISGTVEDYEISQNKSRVQSSFNQSKRIRDEILTSLRQKYGNHPLLRMNENYQAIPEEDFNTGDNEFLDNF